MTNIVFVDVDGTLLDVHRGISIPNSAREALLRVQFDGGKVVLCTGRCLATIPPEVTSLIPWDGMIVSCGCHVIWKGETIFASFLPEEYLRNLIDDYSSVKIDLMLEGPMHVYFPSDAYNQEEMDYIRTLFDDLQTWLPLTTTPLIVNKFSYKTTPENREDDLRLQEKYQKDLDFINYEGGLREATKPGINKGDGIKRILSRFKSERVKTVGIGDSVNDVAMFNTVDLSIALGGCDSDARATADYVTRAIEDDGIAHALIENGIIEPFNW